ESRPVRPAAAAGAAEPRQRARPPRAPAADPAGAGGDGPPRRARRCAARRHRPGRDRGVGPGPGAGEVRAGDRPGARPQVAGREPVVLRQHHGVQAAPGPGARGRLAVPPAVGPGGRRARGDGAGRDRAGGARRADDAAGGPPHGSGRGRAGGRRGHRGDRRGAREDVRRTRGAGRDDAGRPARAVREAARLRGRHRRGRDLPRTLRRLPPRPDEQREVGLPRCAPGRGAPARRVRADPRAHRRVGAV
ncbi:MAG: FIG137478: Hypothetical protein, partial [uncultured Frankineae bacterium]